MDTIVINMRGGCAAVKKGEKMKEYGYFEEKSYVITDRDTPRHWYNYLYNDEYISFVSQVGFGRGFAQDAMGRRLEVVDDRAVYLSEENHFWQANGLPVEDALEDYRATHGIGYTDIMLKRYGIRSSCRFFVPNEGKREYIRVCVTNESEAVRTLRVIPYIATAIDGRYAPQGYETSFADFSREGNCAYAATWSAFSYGRAKRFYAYLRSTETVSGFDTRHTAFIGTYGTKNAPKALLGGGGCTNSECVAERMCLAVENKITLAAGESRVIYYTVGTEDEIAHIPAFGGEEIESQFTAMREKYTALCDKVSIETPWDDLNGLFNDWLKYQTNMGSRWARVRHNGFRDLTSDTECLGCFDAHLAAERLCRVLSFQYENGYAPRTFLDGAIQDKNFSDNTVWLVFAAHAITKELGDTSFLLREVKFNNGSSASVYEHVRRSVEFLWGFTGHDGLVKIWGGDWNDCMGQAGIRGKGVSIWLSIAFVRAAKMLSEMAKWLEKTADAKEAAERASVMEARVNEFGWDGDRYLYAISDDYIPIGARENKEGSMFALPQLWSVFADFERSRSLTAMDTLERELNTDLGLLVSAPPYTEYLSHVGAVCLKHPGLHENGGPYLHAAVWKLAVDSTLGRNDKVEEGLQKILPAHHKYFETAGEPYAMFNSYMGIETGYRAGKPGQSWRTASGQWLLYSLVRFVYGLVPEFDGLRLAPCLPPSFRDTRITKLFRGCRYNVHYVQKDEGGCNQIERLTVNGKDANPSLPIRPIEGGVLDIEVILTK